MKSFIFTIQVTKLNQVNIFELISFHYFVLGHGVYNANIEAYMDTYERDPAASRTSYQAKDNIYGDCLVGTTGDFFPVEVIKRKVLELNSERWTLTLDMCRGHFTRGITKEKIQIEIA